MILEKVRAMLHVSGLPQFLWGEAARHAVWLKNRTLTKTLDGRDNPQAFTPLTLPTRSANSLRHSTVSNRVAGAGTNIFSRSSLMKWDLRSALSTVMNNFYLLFIF